MRELGRSRVLRVALLWGALLGVAAAPLTITRDADDWLADLNEQEDFGRRLLALKALPSVGNDRMPAAVQSIAVGLFSQDLVYREAVREAFVGLGGRVVPFLMRSAIDPSKPMPERVVELLALLGEPAREPVIQWLALSPDPELRRRGALVLREMSATGLSTTLELERLTRDPSPEVRPIALRALAENDLDSASTYAAAQRLHRDPDERTRQLALGVLVRSERTYESARDPAQAAELLAFFERELGHLPEPLRAAFDEGLGRRD